MRHTPIDVSVTTLVDLLEYRASHQPEQTAYTFLADGITADSSFTYGELHQKAQAIAAYLQSQKAYQERVLLLYPPGLDFAAAFFGCLYAGAVAVPAYPPRPNQSIARLQAIAANAQAKIALTTQAVLALVQPQLQEFADLRSLQWQATDNLDKNWAQDWRRVEVSSDNLAFLQYTSGSTSTPKGVMISHANLLHNSSLIYQSFQHSPESRGVIWLPAYHDMGLIGGILQPLYGGFPVFLMSPMIFLQKPFYWLQAISRYQATTSGGPNFAYDLCVRKITPEQRATLDLSSWEVAFNGAEPVRAETMEQFATLFAPCGFRREAFYPCYGMAETTLIIAGGDKAALPTVETVEENALKQHQVIPSDHHLNSQNIVSCGQTLANLQVVIVNPETLTPCSPNEVGEIWVSGASVAQGYWHNPQATKEYFQAYLADSQQGPFLRTGDLGFLHQGELFVTGRLKDLIIIRGRNYYPQDIELTVAQAHPSLRLGAGAAFTIERENGARLVIVQEVERQYLRHLNVAEVVGKIREAVLQQHELQIHTVALIKTATLPKTSSGKVQRYACREHFLAQKLDILPNLAPVSSVNHLLSA
ncbi:beta-ketoacyl synthase [Tolypothrix tenuis PCC 7101]|uniref:Beta-ketoacyl synthase n=1 Tax=Tolypothrix tenuis PCC 7101 TaxID=231146 RepID=A0A1Z4N227_9CYAN|nr:fatty acyl-AMP ligase [Aulosira sp. FACHB-113]BAY99792.1 beta-ketoacyl synthase [Tolypothrix tenuis PCC 7101]BAZ76286.1 beta-ketoacyl synthase [Aulosira laxa NIES-50]